MFQVLSQWRGEKGDDTSSKESSKDGVTKASQHEEKEIPILRQTSTQKEEKPLLEKSAALKGLTFPLPKIETVKVDSPLKGFVRPKEAPAREHGTLPTTRTKEGFDPIAYKLLAKALFFNKGA